MFFFDYGVVIAFGLEEWQEQAIMQVRVLCAGVYTDLLSNMLLNCFNTHTHTHTHTHTNTHKHTHTHASFVVKHAPQLF